jgi:hypothetical protein
MKPEFPKQTGGAYHNGMLGPGYLELMFRVDADWVRPAMCNSDLQQIANYTPDPQLARPRIMSVTARPAVIMR